METSEQQLQQAATVVIVLSAIVFPDSNGTEHDLSAVLGVASGIEYKRILESFRFDF